MLRLRVVRADELLEALAEEHVVPVFSVERVALKEPLVHGGGQAVFNRALRDAQVVPDEPPQSLAEHPFTLPIAEFHPVGRGRWNIKDPLINGGIPHLRRAAQLGQKLPPGSDAAEYAAEAAFLLAEQKLQEVERLKIGGSGKELEASITAFNKKVQETVVVYDKVLTYKRANQTPAAYYRMGYGFELYAKAFLAAPCPPEVRRLGAEACDLYKNKIEENVAGIEEKALQRYSVTLEQAQKLGVANQGTKLARQRANA